MANRLTPKTVIGADDQPANAGDKGCLVARQPAGRGPGCASGGAGAWRAVASDNQAGNENALDRHGVLR